jgi:hypothetical protein
MRSHLVRLWKTLARAVSPPATARPTKRPSWVGHGPERLEERVALSGLQAIGAAPAGCTCPNCARGAAYVLGGGVPGNDPNALKWAQPNGFGTLRTVTYSYSNLLNGGLGGGLSAAQIKAAIQEALGRWAAVAPLRFVELRDGGPAVGWGDYDPTGKPVIRLGHRPKDGGYGTLAYGYYPGSTGFAGDVHFDSLEQWGTNPASGVDLIEVATHEIGHALGLAHSQYGTAIMAGMYAGVYHGPGTSFLYPDDIAGIRALYGAGVGGVVPLAPVLPPGQTFTVIGATLFVQGTVGNDKVEIDAGAAKVTVNGVSYAGSLAAIQAVSVDMGLGGDVANVKGGGAAETFAFRPGQLVMSGGAWSLTLGRAEMIDATGGAGDTATMIGSAGNDLLVSSPGFAQFRGPGFNHVMRGVGPVAAYALAGLDSAVQYGSAGNDAWTANPRVSTMAGGGYSNRADGFEAVYAFSSGGTDTAKLYDSAGNDLFVCGPSSATLKSTRNTYSLVGSNFDTVQAFSTAGTDTAVLYDTAGDDSLIATPTFASLYTAGFRAEASNFDRLFANSRAGDDQAFVYDSAGNDVVGNSGRTVTVSYPMSLAQFTNFSYAAMYGTTGGVNRRPATALPLTVDWYGAWL